MILCLVLIPVAIAAAITAFLVFGSQEVPLAARRPPPTAELTHDVGQYVVGESAPTGYEAPCPMLEGIRIGGTEEDRRVLRTGLAGLCNTTLLPMVEDRVSAFAQAGGVVRFAQFATTGVDSTALHRQDPPTILVNAKFQRTDPLWIAPLVAHDAFLLPDRVDSAEAALQARRAEDRVCDNLLEGRRESRGCGDAEALLELPDPLSALREAGYR